MGEDHKRFKAMKKAMSLTNSDIAEITGNTTDSIKNVTQPNKEFPRAYKLALWVFEKMSHN